MPNHDEDPRLRLLAEAEKLFMKRGFADVSTRDICTAARVKQPTLYHYFRSKEILYLVVAQGWLARFGAGIRTAIAEGTTLAEQLHGIATLFWAGPAGEYQAMQRDVMMHLPPDHLARISQTVWVELLAPIVDLLRAASARGELPATIDPFILMQIFWALVDGTSGIYRRGDPLPAPTQNYALIDFFLAGARAVNADAFAAWPHATPETFLHTQEQE
jgi:AcrR family transcriptional regulator